MMNITKLPDQWRRKSTPVKLQGYMTASCCADELEAALADQWQPIETAPKDGTEIVAGRFNHHFNKWESGVVTWTDETWKVVPTRDYRLSFLGTHWMPLPSPPQDEEDE
jgi:hypothetical protein